MMSGVSDQKTQPVASSGAAPLSGTITVQPGVSRWARWIPTTKPKRREQLAGVLTISPALILILGLTLYPVAYSIWLSLLEKHSFFPQERFVGLENYFYLWKDAEFWSSL